MLRVRPGPWMCADVLDGGWFGVRRKRAWRRETLVARVRKHRCGALGERRDRERERDREEGQEDRTGSK